MKLLFICPQNPFYNGSGAHQRSFLLLRSFIELGYQVDVIFLDKRYNNENDFLISNCNIIFSYDPRDSKLNSLLYYIRYLLGFGIKIKRSKLCKIIRDTIKRNNYDYIISRYIDIVQEGNLENINNVIVDIDDSPEEIYKVRYETTKNIFLKLWYRIAQRNAINYFKKHKESFLMCFYPQKKQCIDSNSFYLPNIPFNIPHIQNKDLNSKSNPYILYVGVMSWMPNYMGMNYFIENIWPSIKNFNNNIKLKIAGKGLPTFFKNKWCKDKQIEVLGFVENLQNLYQNSTLIIAPIYQGGGTNIKVLEAMANQKPIVLTVHATRGFEDIIFDNINAMIAKDDKEFSDKIKILLSNDILRAQMGSKAYKAIIDNYSFDFFKNQINSVFNNINK